MSFYKFARAIVAVVVKVMFKFRVEGLENIKPEDKFIVCANHRTNFDPIFVGVAIKGRELNFMAKDELFKNKFVGFLLSHLGAIGIKRGTGDKDALSRCTEVLNNGELLVVFPEGTRSKDGKLLKAKSGSAVLAQSTKSDVLPVAISFGKKLSFRTTVTVKIGEIVKHEELGFKGESHRELKVATNIIMSKIANLLGVEYN